MGIILWFLQCTFQLIGFVHSQAEPPYKTFPVYWNVPSEGCHKFGLNFSNLEQYGLIQNEDDRFRGDKITILYDPGLFPAILGGFNRNGGVPQEGNLNDHLLIFEKELVNVIKDNKFSGIGVIDFEHWRPIWREDWGILDVYRQISREIEKEKHPNWSKHRIEARAIKRFETAAFRFMNASLTKAIKLRPNGKWGYYAYPYCFNFTPKNPFFKCTDNVQEDNNRSSWMYRTGGALFPSIYLREKELNELKRVKMIKGRIREAKRIAYKNPSKEIGVFPYLAIKYQDTFSFLSKKDMQNAIKTTSQEKTNGLVIWGSYKDTNSKKKCQQLMDYIRDIFYPILKRLLL